MQRAQPEDVESKEFDVVGSAGAVEDAELTEILERSRGELRLHCYRMLGSFEEAEDLVQETLLRAWRGRGGFAGRSSLRTWLYSIATNGCLDAIAMRARRPVAVSAPAAPRASEVSWLQPYPDHLLLIAASSEEQPHSTAVAKETIELAFIVAIQHLPAQQRAAVILRDVLGFSAKETSAALDISLDAANAALKRARSSLRELLPSERLDWKRPDEPKDSEVEVLKRYMRAWESADTKALVELLQEDVRFSMPPFAEWHVNGAEALMAMWVEHGKLGAKDFGDVKCLATRANHQPAVAIYRKEPGAIDFKPLGFSVFEIMNGRIADIVAFAPEFSFPTLFSAFELPDSLS